MRICGLISSTGPGPWLDSHIPGSGPACSGSEGPPRVPTTLSLPHLQLLQSGVCRDRAERGQATPRPRLPITPPTLRRFKSSWGRGADDVMLWGTSVTYFFGFFRVGELTVPSQAAFNLTWGDITREGSHPPAWAGVFLKCSKTNYVVWQWWGLLPWCYRRRPVLGKGSPRVCGGAWGDTGPILPLRGWDASD